MIDGRRETRGAIRWGMVGGGAGSQIGYSHRSAALRDRHFDLVAGAFDVDPARGRAFGVDLGLDPARCHGDYQSLFAAEAAREDGIRAVSVATPNATHYAITKAALEHGLHVLCEKPLTFTLAEAEELKRLAEAKGLVVAVAYGYVCYPMIAEARALVASGALGDIRLVNMQFAHGFHSAPVEDADPAARWRMTPAVAGPSYVLGDLGTHPFALSQVICPELEIRRLMCARQSFVPSRAPLEDNAVVLMDYATGAFGTAWISAVNAGAMHGQTIRVVGSKASIEWWDEHPNQLRLEIQGEPPRLLDRAMAYLHAEARAEDRIGGGHPEGYFDAWANLYRRFAHAIEAAETAAPTRRSPLPLPDITLGLDGVRWVETCVRSADQGGVWVEW